MRNSNASEKSRGIVLFATNTETVDYELIAKRSKRLIEHHLKLPVTILTGRQAPNTRLSVDTGEIEQWNNLDRYRAFELSPYDQTLLLDSDYLVLDDNLNKLFDIDCDYQIMSMNEYVDHPNSSYIMGPHSIPYLWATVIMFNRTERSNMLFDLVGRVQRNYTYYRKLYNIKDGNYRNDYAFAIADNMLNGYTQDSSNYIPWTMLTVARKIEKMYIQDGKIILKNTDKATVLPKTNIHVMSKEWLQGNEYKQFIKDVVNG